MRAVASWVQDRSAEFVAAGASAAALRGRARDVRRFAERFGDVERWLPLSVGERLAAPVAVRSYVGWAVVATATPVDADYVATVSTTWAGRVARRHPDAYVAFREVAFGLGFCELEVPKMWSALAKVSVIAGMAPDVIADEAFVVARDQLVAAVRQINGCVPKTTTTPLFGLNAVLFHLRRAGRPPLRRSPAPTRESEWHTLGLGAPQLVSTMRRYLAQLSVSLRASSVEQIDTTLRLLAGYLAGSDPTVTAVAAMGRTQVEGFKTFLRGRPGRGGRTSLTNTTMAMRVGHLRAFFDRIIRMGLRRRPGPITGLRRRRPDQGPGPATVPGRRGVGEAPRRRPQPRRTLRPPGRRGAGPDRHAQGGAPRPDH